MEQNIRQTKVNLPGAGVDPNNPPLAGAGVDPKSPPAAGAIIVE